MADTDALTAPFVAAFAARLDPPAPGSVGVLAVGAPVELILAAGRIPRRLFPDPAATTDLADGWMEPVFDGAVRSLFDRFLRGDFQAATAVLIPRYSESWLQLFYFLQQIERERVAALLPALHLFDLLKTPNHATRRYVRAQLEACRCFLEPLAGGPIDDAAIGNAIALLNRQRQRLADVDALRRADTPTLSGSELLTVVAAAGVLPPSEHIAAMDALLAGADRRPRRPAGPRLLVKGSATEGSGFYGLVESMGAHIVADDHADGIGPWQGRVDDSVAPLDALARHYHHVVPTARTVETEDDVVRRARAARVDGVVFFVESHDDTLGWDVPPLRLALDRHGIASIALIDQRYRDPDRAAQRALLEPWLDGLPKGGVR